MFSLGEPLIRAEKKVVTLKPSLPEQACTCVGMWLSKIAIHIHINHFPTSESGFLLYLTEHIPFFDTRCSTKGEMK